MVTLERLGAGDLVAVVTAYRDALRAHQETINRLNVYPVPDGDTGTNMALTLDSVIGELSAHDADDLAAVTAALSHGSLMGARGNSGVILSQILRGISDVVRDAGGIDATVVPVALRRATDGAYAAVGNPVEGTILSVVRAAAEAAERCGAGASLVDVLANARDGAAEGLARTPDQLAVLKSAGVVDAGGAGLLLLLDSFLYVAVGRPLPVPEEATSPGDAPRPAQNGAGDGGDAGELRYEVMYLLEAPDESVPTFKNVWAGVGDSIVVVGGGGIWNCHIHTNDIGAAIEAALDAGRPCNIRVTDLWDQVEEERWVREAVGNPPAPDPATPVACAVVAVCTGEGIRRIFRSLGVTQTVAGGQSMNPSTQQLADAIAAAPSEQVVVLPNNKNIIAVAEQAAATADKTVRVVPTRGIPEGFAALLDYDPEGSADANAELMAAGAARVVAGEVTRAARESSSDGGPIHEGDFLGLSRSRIEAVAATAPEAATSLLGRLIDDAHHEIVTIIEGEGAAAADTRAITEWLSEHQPDVTVEVHHGGQPLYPYLFSIE
ncbi:MAG TPA: DAK2 domain-containing protein [Acidimicrobiales bacterium]|jgi:hypothetical protein|nr:DAK2 domain-containing protein [Acidimicrobiales bacterium]